MELTQSAVSRIWRAFGLQPHRQQTWQLSRDGQFVAKVRDVVGLYLDPPERAVVDPGARTILSEFDDFATHYEVLLEAVEELYQKQPRR